MELNDVNFATQASGFKSELVNFSTCRRRNAIPKIESVFKKPKQISFFKNLYQASWESHGDTKLNNKKLSEISGYSEKQVTRLLKIAEKAGLISMLHVRGFNGDSSKKYSKLGNKTHKMNARKRYWTWRCIRVWEVLANHRYVTLDYLGWKNDFRPKGDSIYLKSRRKIPLPEKIKHPVAVICPKTKKDVLVMPDWVSKADLVKKGYVWPTFFSEMEIELSYRSCPFEKDSKIQVAVFNKYGYGPAFWRDRFRAVSRKQWKNEIPKNNTELWYNKKMGLIEEGALR